MIIFRKIFFQNINILVYYVFIYHIVYSIVR